jgi:acyl-CoA thioester hydrolase
MEQDGFTLPVVEAACRYHRPARYDDELDVRTTGTLVTPVRLQFDYEVVRNADEARIVSGRTLHVTLNTKGRPCRLPERARILFT